LVDTPRRNTRFAEREYEREYERDDVNDDTKGQTKSSEECFKREEPATRFPIPKEPFAHPSSFDFKEEDEEEEEDL